LRFENTRSLPLSVLTPLAKDERQRRKSIDFSKGVRGKYVGVKLAIVGPTPEERDKDKQERRKQ